MGKPSFTSVITFTSPPVCMPHNIASTMLSKVVTFTNGLDLDLEKDEICLRYLWFPATL